MKVDFPSASFFEALNARMAQEQDRFTKLGYFDTTFGVTVVGPGEQRRNYLLNFEVYECMGAREIDNLEGEDPDFVLEADIAQWQDMLRNIQSNGGADTDHGINTLTHFGEGMKVIYDDPERHDKLFRFSESIQEYFDLAAGLEIEYAS
ncbi:MAG TPA: hypothetical protein EYG16_09990 [Deltaproteobacteria bacterium]|nr:hypothetical protein [Candidatus Binatota bacterium]HIL13987.1 hypothetical protein [Deltaproteobacteria bacterium]